MGGKRSERKGREKEGDKIMGRRERTVKRDEERNDEETQIGKESKERGKDGKREKNRRENTREEEEEGREGYVRSKYY